MTIYSHFTKSRSSQQKRFAVLIDPDKYTLEKIRKLIKVSVKAGVDFFFFGAAFFFAAFFFVSILMFTSLRLMITSYE